MAARAGRVATATLVPLAAALAVILAVAAPASATFAATRRLASMTVSTAVVAPPTGVTATLGSCSNARYMSETVSWTASTSRGVSGYRVDAHRSDGSTLTVKQVGPTETSASTTVDKLASGPTAATFTVVTLTTYGWTAESSSSGSLTC